MEHLLRRIFKGVAQKSPRDAQTAANREHDSDTAVNGDILSTIVAPVKPEDPEASNVEQALNKPNAVSSTKGHKRPAEDLLKPQMQSKRPKLFASEALKCDDSSIATKGRPVLQQNRQDLEVDRNGIESFDSSHVTSALAAHEPVQRSLALRSEQEHSLKLERALPHLSSSFNPTIERACLRPRRTVPTLRVKAERYVRSKFLQTKNSGTWS